MSWLLWILIGFAFGGVAGIVCGLMMADNHWRKHMCPYCDHDYEKYKQEKSERK